MVDMSDMAESESDIAESESDMVGLAMLWQINKSASTCIGVDEVESGCNSRSKENTDRLSRQSCCALSRAWPNFCYEGVWRRPVLNPYVHTVIIIIFDI